ncbi:hypothetical protein D3C80_941740 [compost metagenome]
MESLSPNPAKINAVQPATPHTVMNIRCLYRNRFLAVTLPMNPSRFHINEIRSSIIRWPPFGAFGRINTEALLRSSTLVVIKAVNVVQINATMTDMML